MKAAAAAGSTAAHAETGEGNFVEGGVQVDLGPVFEDRVNVAFLIGAPARQNIVQRAFRVEFDKAGVDDGRCRGGVATARECPCLGEQAFERRDVGIG